jgi:hypothetical protein
MGLEHYITEVKYGFYKKLQHLAHFLSDEDTG